MRVSSPYSACLVALTVLAQGSCRFSYELLDDPVHLGGALGDGDGDGDGDGINGDGGSRLGGTGGAPSRPGGSGGMSQGGHAAGGNTGGEPAGGAETGGSHGTGGSGTSGGSGGADGSGGVDASGGAEASGGSMASGGSGGSDGSGGVDGSGGTSHTGDLVVDITNDEEDAGASPSVPGGAGLSLREAILFSNADADRQHITFSTQSPIVLSRGALPVVEQPLHLEGSAAIDASGISTATACLEINAADVTVEKLEIFGCPVEPLVTGSLSGPNVLITQCYVHDNGQAALFFGDAPKVISNSFSASGGAAAGILASGTQFWGNLMVDAIGPGVYLDGGVAGVTLIGNITYRVAYGFLLLDASNVTMWHNTLHQSHLSALHVNGATDLDFRNNMVTTAGTYGIEALTSHFAHQDYNLFGDITQQNCSGCTLGPNSLISATPGYTNPAALDFTLQPSSPAVDAGTHLGDDRNLGLPGLFNGNGPDLGALEAP